jgi:hypothetical protein
MPRKNKKSVRFPQDQLEGLEGEGPLRLRADPGAGGYRREVERGAPQGGRTHQAKLVANDKDSASAKYEVAVRVKNVMEGEVKYEPEAVKKLARLLGLKWQLLYAWAEVARAWSTREAFLKVVSRLNSSCA